MGKHGKLFRQVPPSGHSYRFERPEGGRHIENLTKRRQRKGSREKSFVAGYKESSTPLEREGVKGKARDTERGSVNNDTGVIENQRWVWNKRWQGWLLKNGQSTSFSTKIDSKFYK